MFMTRKERVKKFFMDLLELVKMFALCVAGIAFMLLVLFLERWLYQ